MQPELRSREAGAGHASRLGRPAGLQMDNDGAFCGGYKVPRVFEFRASLPRSATGKVLRHLIETA